MRRWIVSALIACTSFGCGGRSDGTGDGGDAHAVGSPCVRNSECDRGLCLPITDALNVCTAPCQTLSDCVAGWTCGTVSGVEGDVCQCSPSREECDGSDNDCDGTIDDGRGEEVGCPVGNACVDMGCVCAPENLCDGECVDLSSDRNHCGACGMACTLAMGCSGGSCVAPAGITAGNHHACVWYPDGPTYCWGANGSEQIVLGSTEPLVPTRMAFRPARMVAAGGSHTCVADVDGNVACQGWSNAIGAGSVSPTLHVATPITTGDAAGVVAGGAHSCAWTRDGTALCWGFNSAGQLGIEPVGTNHLVPTQVPGLPPVVTMAAGDNTTCAIVEGGDLYCWGLVVRSDGFPAFTATPQRLDLSGAQRVAAQSHQCAITSDASLFCLGRNEAGELGLPSSTSYTNVPTLIDVAPTTRVAVGADHTCAVRSDRDLFCWGDNNSGQLGDGGSVSRETEGEPIPGHTFRDVAAGLSHTCAIADDGVFCWGSDGSGEMGDGDPGGIQYVPTSPAF